MTLETFFEKFDQFADAPDAVAKMRSLILRLAMQGKLSEPHKTDDPVSELLREVEKDKMRLGLESSAKATNGTSSILDDEPEDVIPARWTWVRFGNIARHNAGKTLDKGRNRGELRDYITTSNLYWGFFQLNAVRQMPILDDELERCTAMKGDLLICEGGEAGRAAVWPHDRDISFQNHVHRARFFAGINPYFVQRYLEKLNATGEVEKYRKGVGISNMSGKALASIPIPLPPLAEQKRIVVKVDELMALCDRLETQQQERDTRHAGLARASLARFADAPTPANLNLLFHDSYTITPSDIRKSILTLAVQGKLVPQDPNDESAAVLLAGIAADVAKAVRAKQMRNSKSIPPYEDEFPFDLPCGWEWAPLGTLTAAEDGAMCDGPFGSKLKTEHYISTKGYAVLRLGNIGVGYFIHGKEGHISPEHFESLSSNHTAPGDLLVAGLADPLVRCCEVPPDIGPAVNKSDCFRVRINSRMDRSYVRHYLNSPIAKAFAAEENHGMTRERINLGDAKALPMSVPPLAEQRRIVAKVEQLMALVDQLETQLAASRATAANLLSALVAELTDTSNNSKVSVPSASVTGRRGRPPKS